MLKTNSVSKQETDQAVANQAAQVYAPFDGVITVRNTDIGALIDAGSSSQSRELFHMTAISTLRVFVPVPEVYSSAAGPGAWGIRPGSSQMPAMIHSVTIPANTLLFRREGLRVGVVRDGVPVSIGRDYGARVEIVSGLRPADSIILDPSDSLEDGAPVRLQRGSAAGELQGIAGLEGRTAWRPLASSEMVGGFRRSAAHRARRAGGASPKSDVAQAQTQFDSASAQETDIDVQRAQFEHAIATLEGRRPHNSVWKPRPCTPSHP